MVQASSFVLFFTVLIQLQGGAPYSIFCSQLFVTSQNRFANYTWSINGPVQDVDKVFILFRPLTDIQILLLRQMMPGKLCMSSRRLRP